MRPKYDFSVLQFEVLPQGANIAVNDPAVLDVFPDGARVNQALRALAPFYGNNAEQHRSEKARNPVR